MSYNLVLYKGGMFLTISRISEWCMCYTYTCVLSLIDNLVKPHIRKTVYFDSVTQGQIYTV